MLLSFFPFFPPYMWEKSALSLFSRDSPAGIFLDFFFFFIKTSLNLLKTRHPQTPIFLHFRGPWRMCDRVPDPQGQLPVFLATLGQLSSRPRILTRTHISTPTSARCVDGPIFTLFRDHATSALCWVPVVNTQTP